MLPAEGNRAPSLRSYRFLSRKEYDKQGSSLRRPLGANRPVMTVNDLGNDRQAQSHSRLLRGYKRIKNLLPQLVRNTGAAVADVNGHSRPSILRAGRGLDAQCPPRFFHCLICILDQIDKRLLGQTLIERNLRESRCVDALHLRRLSIPVIADVFQHTIKQYSDVRSLTIRLQRSRKVEKLCHQTAEPIDFTGNISGQLAGEF